MGLSRITPNFNEPVSKKAHSEYILGHHLQHRTPERYVQNNLTVIPSSQSFQALIADIFTSIQRDFEASDYEACSSIHLLFDSAL